MAYCFIDTCIDSSVPCLYLIFEGFQEDQFTKLMDCGAKETGAECFLSQDPSVFFGWTKTFWLWPTGHIEWLCCITPNSDLKGFLTQLIYNQAEEKESLGFILQDSKEEWGETFHDCSQWDTWCPRYGWPSYQCSLVISRAMLKHRLVITDTFILSSTLGNEDENPGASEWQVCEAVC